MNDFPSKEFDTATPRDVDTGSSAYSAKPRRIDSRSGIGWLAAGAALTAAAVVVRRRSQEAERANPPAGQFIEVSGVRLHYVEKGQGQPLVLLHGNGTLMQDFEISGLIDKAAEKYRVIAFDRPGYGYSGRPRTTIWTPQAQARLLHQALLRLGISQPIILGHSWGAMVAVSMALDFPDDVKSLVLLSGYYYPTARMDVPFLVPPAIPLIGDLMRYTVSPLIGRAIWPVMLRRLFAPAPVPQHYKEGFPTWMALRPGQMRAAAAESGLLIPAAYAMQARYHEMLLPVVIMAGDSDKYVDTQMHSERLHQELPHSTFHVTHGAGHMVHHVEQDQVMSAIDEASTAMGAIPPMHAKHVFPASPQIN